MTIELVVLGVIIIALGFVILDHCKGIRSDLQWLRARFVSERMSEFGRPINLARELENLAPLYFMPFADIANEIRRARAAVDREFDQSLEYWEGLELKEMEISAATSQAYDKPFVPSQALIFAKKGWLIERIKSDRVSEWESLFQDVFLSVLNGKLDITEAKHRLQYVKQGALLDIGSGRDRQSEKIIEEFFSGTNSEWAAGEWKKRIEYLREMKELRK